MKLKKKYKRLVAAIISVMTVVTAIASEVRESIKGMDPYEKTVLIIKYYETMHYNKGVYIGYGHQIQPGEGYKQNQRLSEAEADLLLRRDVYRLYNKFKGYGDYAWLLTALSYNVGPYALLGSKHKPKSNLLMMIESGEQMERIKEEYLKFCHIAGKAIKSIYRRRLMEFDLLLTPYDIHQKD